MNPRKRIGEMLMEAGIIDETQLKAALGHQRQWGVRLGQALVDLKLATEADVVGALSVKFGFGVAELNGLEPYALEQALKLLPRDFAVRNNVFPMGADTATITVAMSDPTNLAIVDEIRFRTGRKVKVSIGGDREVAEALHRHYPSTGGAVEAIALDLDADDGEVEALFDPFGGGSKDALEAFFSAGPEVAVAAPAAAAPEAAPPAEPPATAPFDPHALSAPPQAARPAPVPVPRPAPAQKQPLAVPAPPRAVAPAAGPAARAAPPAPAPAAARPAPVPHSAAAVPVRAPAAAKPAAAAAAPAQRAAPAAVSPPAPAPAPAPAAPAVNVAVRRPEAKRLDLELEELTPGPGGPVATQEATGTAEFTLTEEVTGGDFLVPQGPAPARGGLGPRELEVLHALERLAGGAHAEPEILKPAQAMAALALLLVKKGIVGEQELLAALTKP